MILSENQALAHTFKTGTQNLIVAFQKGKNLF